MNGFIKLHRQMVEWEWYTDIPTKTLFLHLLLMANYEDNKWRGKVVKRGQRITSIPKLAEETGLSERQVRTALEKLEATGELTRQATNRYTLITIENYAKYQDKHDKSDMPDVRQNDTQKADRCQTDDNKQEIKKEKKENIIKNEKNDIPPGMHISPGMQRVYEYRNKIGGLK